MDRESLIKIATECGMLVTQQSRPDATMYGSGGGIDVERFAAAVAAAVKEDDARICAGIASVAIAAQQGPHEDLCNVMLRHHAVSATTCEEQIRASIKGAKS